MVVTMTAGTAVIMWLGELITDRGVGNGMSLLIFTSIIATFPSPWQRSSPGLGGPFVLRHRWSGWSSWPAVIFVEQAPAPDPGAVRQADGRAARCTAARSTYIPLKVNMAGVIPVIFASSLLFLPGLFVQFPTDSAGRAVRSSGTSCAATTRSTCSRSSC